MAKIIVYMDVRKWKALPEIDRGSDSHRARKKKEGKKEGRKGPWLVREEVKDGGDPHLSQHQRFPT